MKKPNSISLDEKCNEIIQDMPHHLNCDQKMRYLYHEVCMIFSKSTKFFYDRDESVQKDMYNNYTYIDNYEVICRSVVHVLSKLAKKVDLDCQPIEITGVEAKYNHWALEYKNNNKRYIINPIPDFYRVQMGFSTKSFCSSENYYGYDGMPFDVMDDEYLRSLDESLGYLSNGMYTDELLDKLRNEMRAKLGTHIVRTTDIYQEYYLKMLELNKNDKLSLDEKLQEISKLDWDYEKHKDIIKNNLERKTIDKEMKNIIHNLSFQSLSGKDSDLDRKREGSNYVGSFDIRNMKNIKEEMLIYKFNYMMNCLTSFTGPLTGYIENKSFMDELSNYIFSSKDEKDRIHRHTVIKEDNGNNQYYMMFSLEIGDSSDKMYCFYNQNEKKFNMGIEPLSFMMEHHMKPLKDSSLNSEIDFDSFHMEQSNIKQSK